VTALAVGGRRGLRAHVVEVPLVVPFRRVDRRRAVLVEGPAGWGEFSPFPGYPPAVTRWWWACAREAAEEGWPAPRRRAVPVNTTVPAVDAATAHRMAAASGCAAAKVKVAEPGQSLVDDLARVAAVRDAVGAAGQVRVDANGAWDVEEAVTAIARLHRAAGGLEYVEQPCATLEQMAAVRRALARRGLDVLLAADESVRTAEDPLRVAGLEAADVVVVKVQPLGGVRRALQVVEAAGLPAVVSSAVETSVGLAAGVALAAALPELPHACGLGTQTLLAGDVTTAPLAPVAGTVEVRRVVPDPALLDRWAAPDPGSELARLDAAAAAGEGAA
jgi:o-succinylbenzoate synthase